MASMKLYSQREPSPIAYWADGLNILYWALAHNKHSQKTAKYRVDFTHLKSQTEFINRRVYINDNQTTSINY